MNFFKHNKSEKQNNFFDAYPEFFREKGVNAFPNRLNRRYEAIIEQNKEMIEGKKILDIACTDGRWTLAAIQNGARHVTGIELVPDDIKIAIEIMTKYNIPKEKFTFIIGDVHQEIKKIESNSIDTVFCLGFFYHTMFHMDLLLEIKRINPKHIIFDTHISQDDSPSILIKKSGNRIGERKLEGFPTKKAIEMMLEHFRYNYEYFDWHKILNDWKNLGDYKNNERVTLTATRI